MASIVADVYDENGNKIDCKYQGFHYETGNWSTVTRDTENQQISFDTNDDDWDNEGVACPDGDTLLIVGWVDGDDRNSKHSKFGVTKIASTGDSRYVIDMQLKPCFEPTIGIDIVSGDDFQRDTEIVANVSVQSIYQWIYNDRTFYQRANWYGENIFSFLNDYSIQYDFGDGYQDNNKHTYSEEGEYTIKAKVTTGCDKEITIEKNVKIKYKKPVIDAIIPNEANIGDEVNIKSKITDEDNTITSITWFYDGQEVASTSDLEYSFSKNIDQYKDSGYEVKVVVEYNNGYEDKTIYRTWNISIVNNGPLFNLIQVDLTKNEKKYIITNAINNSGNIDELNSMWNIYFKVPFKKEYVKVYTIDYGSNNSLESKILIYDAPGEYEIECIVKDKYGVERSKYVFTIIEEICPEQSGSTNNNTVIIKVDSILWEGMGAIEDVDIEANVDTQNLGTIEVLEIDANRDETTTEIEVL